MFHSDGRSFQVLLAMLMLGVLVVMGGASLLGSDSSDPAQRTPWGFLFGLVGSMWLLLGGLFAVMSRQRVVIGTDGHIEVKSVLNGFRTRRFHAREVDALHYGNWQHSTQSVVSELGVALRPAPHRRWNRVRVMNTHVADGGELALFRAIAAAVHAAQPELPLPRELAPDNSALPPNHAARQHP
ncbi:hypothetical protein ACLB90_05660 [Stenotrophomonas sp. LGBM10]|uniref:hypothetical protein n=1 Tax=Stenotrophomonas sp. LGBM10 TaxID=3390038 RepID=UPI00398AE2EF